MAVSANASDARILATIAKRVDARMALDWTDQFIQFLSAVGCHDFDFDYDEDLDCTVVLFQSGRFDDVHAWSIDKNDQIVEQRIGEAGPYWHAWGDAFHGGWDEVVEMFCDNIDLDSVDLLQVQIWRPWHGPTCDSILAR